MADPLIILFSGCGPPGGHTIYAHFFQCGLHEEVIYIIFRVATEATMLTLVATEATCLHLVATEATTLRLCPRRMPGAFYAKNWYLSNPFRQILPYFTPVISKFEVHTLTKRLCFVIIVVTIKQ